MSKSNASHYQDFTSLDEWLYYLENLHAVEIDLGLTRIKQVADRLAIDLSFATVITVAGTNGKGTTCAFLENALLDGAFYNKNSINSLEKAIQPSITQANISKTVAVYSSPHIELFNERLRINKCDVNDLSLIDAFVKIEEARKDTSLSYYEYTTLAAFLVLMVMKPDYIILEVGLGGRLDATNIIDADVAVITTIDLDHQSFLGDNRESIGFEKAGIMRPNQVIVIGDTCPPKSVIEYADKISGNNKENIYIRNQHFSVNKHNVVDNKNIDESQIWSWDSSIEQYISVNQLADTHIPRDNVATALMVLSVLATPFHFTLDRAFINRIIDKTRVPGRTELFFQKESCDVLLDVAHNPQASQYLGHYLGKLTDKGTYRKIHAVVAMLSDKDIANSLGPLTEYIEHWYVGQLTVPRAATVDSMKQQLIENIKQQVSLNSSMINGFGSVSDAFKASKKQAESTDLIVVFGSFHTVAEVRQLLLVSTSAR